MNINNANKNIVSVHRIDNFLIICDRLLSFPRKRESRAYGMFHWIPAYSGMTSKWSQNIFSITSLAIIFIFLYFSAGNIHALDGISIGSGPAGAAGINSIHFGLEKTWTKQWFEDCPWNVRGYWDLSFYTMRRPHKENFETNNKIQAIAVAPVFRFYKTEPVLQSKVFYIELAVGLAQMNKRSIGQRELGTNFQFEDRLGVGLRFGKQKQYDLNYRVVHFSNAYIGHKNHGINLHLLSINYWFT